MTTPLRFGTRGSPLALWQANYVAALLHSIASPSRPIDLVKIETGGDQARERPLSEIAGEGVFTKEIQRALLDGAIDIAVHSLKDLPTIPIEGLVLAAVPERGPARDVFVSRRYSKVSQLPARARVATSSLRRRAQLLHFRPGLTMAPIRGNVETRLRKLAEEKLDGLILAQAGLERLGLTDAVSEVLDQDWMLPAVGQGALGIECRSGDASTRLLVEQLSHAPTFQAVLAERSLLRSLGGGCQVPLGALAECQEGALILRAAVLDPNGIKRIAGSVCGRAEWAEELGRQLAQDLCTQGALELMYTNPPRDSKSH
jgi:hydroxymethylbilane synthase